MPSTNIDITEQLVGEYRKYEAAKDLPRFNRHVTEAINKYGLVAEEVSINEVFRETVSDADEILRDWGRNPNPNQRMSLIKVKESGVETSAFTNIIGQLLVNRVLETMKLPKFIGDSLCETWQSKLPRGEKFPGVSMIGDEAERIGEGMPYPNAGLLEDWVESPEAYKRGFIIPLTREVVLQDLTGMLLTEAARVTEFVALNKEMRILACVTGNGPNTWNRKGLGIQTTYATYAATTHDFTNLMSGNDLKNYTNIEQMLLMFDKVQDPNTGIVIDVLNGDRLQVLVPSAKALTALNIKRATQVRIDNTTDTINTGAVNNTTATSTNTGIDYRSYAPNPLDGSPNGWNLFDIITSQLVAVASGSTANWFAGIFKKAFKYTEISPAQAVEAPANSEMEFTNDIIQRWKVSEWGVPWVYNPRYVAESTP
jgi:hypothetical protein